MFRHTKKTFNSQKLFKKVHTFITKTKILHFYMIFLKF